MLSRLLPSHFTCLEVILSELVITASWCVQRFPVTLHFHAAVLVRHGKNIPPTLTFAFGSWARCFRLPWACRRTSPIRSSASSLFQQVATPVGRFRLVADGVRQRHLTHFTGCGARGVLSCAQPGCSIRLPLCRIPDSNTAPAWYSIAWRAAHKLCFPDYAGLSWRLWLRISYPRSR